MQNSGCGWRHQTLPPGHEFIQHVRLRDPDVCTTRPIDRVNISSLCSFAPGPHLSLHPRELSDLVHVKKGPSFSTNGLRQRMECKPPAAFGAKAHPCGFSTGGPNCDAPGRSPFRQAFKALRPFLPAGFNSREALAGLRPTVSRIRGTHSAGLKSRWPSRKLDLKRVFSLVCGGFQYWKSKKTRARNLNRVKSCRKCF